MVLEERIRQFRDERLGLIAEGKAPVSITDGPKVILHIVPVGFSDPAFSVDASTLSQHEGRMLPLVGGASRVHPNFEGYIAYSEEISTQGAPSTSYLQVLRSGVVEAVDTDLLSNERNGSPYVPIRMLEDDLINRTRMYLELLKESGSATSAFPDAQHDWSKRLQICNFRQSFRGHKTKSG